MNIRLHTNDVQHVHHTHSRYSTYVTTLFFKSVERLKRITINLTIFNNNNKKKTESLTREIQDVIKLLHSDTEVTSPVVAMTAGFVSP